MIDMQLLQTWWGKLRWVVILAGCALMAYLARGFGQTTKREEYKEVIEDFKAHKLDEILVREQYALEKRDAQIEGPAEAARTRVKDLADELDRISADHRVRMPQMTPRDLGEALNK